jgi:hypothetical protein
MQCTTMQYTTLTVIYLFATPTFARTRFCMRGTSTCGRRQASCCPTRPCCTCAPSRTDSTRQRRYCAVLCLLCCCAVVCCGVVWCVMLCYVVWCVMLCYVVWWCCVVLFVVVCYAVLWYGLVLCCGMLAVLCMHGTPVSVLLMESYYAGVNHAPA